MQLNGEQQRSVSAMCTVARGQKPLALFGPPGTGKTVRPAPASPRAAAARLCNAVDLAPAPAMPPAPAGDPSRDGAAPAGQPRQHRPSQRAAELHLRHVLPAPARRRRRPRRHLAGHRPSLARQPRGTAPRPRLPFTCTQPCLAIGPIAYRKIHACSSTRIRSHRNDPCPLAHCVRAPVSIPYAANSRPLQLQCLCSSKHDAYNVTRGWCRAIR